MDPASDTPNSDTPKTAYPLIGQVVGGRYHIVSLIGEGGMGVVYKAEQRLGSTVRRVAVKTLHAELSRDASITARFHREVGTVAQLEHPNTVRVYDFGSTDDGTLYIAMEFLDGKALNRVIESEGALDPRRVGHLLRQVAGSLDEAHRQGIVHRDLKPENVLLIERAGEKDVVKLVDFGIAARTESAEREKEQKLTQQGMVLGTPPYMSPEQFTGKLLDARSDVYSLGVMVYEMLTGQLPFQADTAWQWATHHMTSPPRSFDETPGGGRIPEALRRTVLKALSKEPSDRQNSAGQFYTEFVASLGTPTSMAAPKMPAAFGKTEAMPQATPFMMAPTEGMPVANVAPAMPSPPVALPPAPPPAASTSNKGLIYGLSGVGAVLLLAMGWIAVSGGRGSGSAAPIDVTTPPSSTPTSEAPAGSESAPPAAAESPDPEVSAAQAAPERPSAAQPERSKPSASATKPTPAKPTASSSPPASSSSTKPPAAPSPAATPAASNPPTNTPTTPPVATPAPSAQPAPTAPVSQPAPPPVTQPSPQPAPKPAPSAPPAAPSAPAGDACGACMKAAASKDIPGAGRAYAQCGNPAARSTCSNRVAQTAPRLAEAAAFNQQCDQARLIIAAALQMGVPAGRLAKAQNACK
jgi:eukaryotic-like serine/threonine-protein kinase